MDKIKYVVGFAFNETASKVVLTLKDRPSWQAGFKNGVGGKIEEGESPLEAMVRECKEETSLTIAKNLWSNFATIETPTAEIHFFKSFSNISEAKQQANETEEITIEAVENITNIKTISNLQWLIPLALDDGNIQASIQGKAKG